MFKLYDITKKMAFTLAEVLITLGIIGIVADMTIPTIQASTQKQTQVTTLKKVYTNMTEAVRTLMADEGVNRIPETSLSSNSASAAGTFLKKYFMVIRDCGVANPNPCMASKYRTLDHNSSDQPWNGPNYYCVVISDGSSLCMKPNDTYPAGFFVDTNGAKSPNVSGRDLFWLNIYYDGRIDEPFIHPGYSDKSGGRNTRFNTVCFGNGTGYLGGCFGKILNDGWVMDY